MRWAICMSIDRGFGSIFLEGDSLICYQALYSSDSSVPQRIKTIVQDISRKVSRFQDLSFSWVSRVANAAAHCFVEWSLNCNFVGSVGTGWCPPCLEIALVKDSVPLQFVCLVLIKFYIHKKEKKKKGSIASCPTSPSSTTSPVLMTLIRRPILTIHGILVLITLN